MIETSAVFVLTDAKWIYALGCMIDSMTYSLDVVACALPAFTRAWYSEDARRAGAAVLAINTGPPAPFRWCVVGMVWQFPQPSLAIIRSGVSVPVTTTGAWRGPSETVEPSAACHPGGRNRSWSARIWAGEGGVSPSCTYNQVCTAIISLM